MDADGLYPEATVQQTVTKTRQIIVTNGYGAPLSVPVVAFDNEGR